MADNTDELLWIGLREISAETIACLGERSHCFLALYNDWLETWGSMWSVYSQDLPLTSLVAADLMSLGKDLHWLHRLLHWGNYPLIARVLRYDWELMFRACYADVYQPNIPGDADLPGPAVDDKIHWLEERERGLHFNTIIVPILNAMLPSEEREHYKQIWRHLNKHIHPTKHIRYRMIDESALVMRDSFDKEWAEETIRIGCDVFDLIWRMTLTCFPKCVPQLAGQSLFKYAPKTSRLILEAPEI